MLKTKQNPTGTLFAYNKVGCVVTLFIFFSIPTTTHPYMLSDIKITLRGLLFIKSIFSPE